MERHWDTASPGQNAAPANDAVLVSRRSFCDYLVSARKQRNLSIHEISTITRIPVRSLERLESGLFEELPADVFVRGFLRSYARCVGLDGEDTIRRYTGCGMTPAPVSSPMADELATSLATLDEGRHPSVRQVIAPPSPRSKTEAPVVSSATPVDAASIPRPARSPESSAALGRESREPEVAIAAAAARPETQASPTGQISIDDRQIDGRQIDEHQASAPKTDERQSRRKRKRRRRQRREGSESVAAASQIHPAQAETTGTPERAPAAEAPGANEVGGESPVQAPAIDAARETSEKDPLASAPAVASSLLDSAAAERLTAPAAQPPAQDVVQPMASQDVVQPMASPLDALRHAARRAGRRRASAAARPVLIIDDEHPEEAERSQEERVERSDASWRSLLPPALLDSDDGSHRGTLTLAVIILVIVATLTMSYLLRRPNVSGDGVTWREPIPGEMHHPGRA
jgi:hypothetical protein